MRRDPLPIDASRRFGQLLTGHALVASCHRPREDLQREEDAAVGEAVLGKHGSEEAVQGILPGKFRLEVEPFIGLSRQFGTISLTEMAESVSFPRYFKSSKGTTKSHAVRRGLATPSVPS